MSKNRRQDLYQKLITVDTPITGTELSNIYKVSRQVIVQDIAILRAQGYNIMATSNGYMIPNYKDKGSLIKTFESKHSSEEEMKEELEILLDYGCKIINVTIEHDVYGEITGNLMISNRLELDNFIAKMKNAEPLSLLTSGNHMHTIEVASEKVFLLLSNELKEKGYLV